RALHRSGRWHRTGRRALDRLQTWLLPAGARALAPIPAVVFCNNLDATFAAGELQFFSGLAELKAAAAFAAYLVPLRKREWVVYAKRPFAGLSQVLAYLARYTHRVAI